MDDPDWPDQIDDVRRSRPRHVDYTEKLQKKANRAAGSNIPTILVVFSEIEDLSYEGVDISAFHAVIVIDETTYNYRVLER